MKRFLNEKPVEKFCLLGVASFAFATAVQIGCSTQAYDAGTSEDGVNEARYGYGYGNKPTREPPIVITVDAGSAGEVPVVDAGSTPRVDAGRPGSIGDGGLDVIPGTGSGRGTPPGSEYEEPSPSKKKSSSSGSAATESGESEPTTSTPKKKASSGMACNASPNSAGSSGFAALLAATLLFVRRRSSKRSCG